jgi:hypothetical protein
MDLKKLAKGAQPGALGAYLKKAVARSSGGRGRLGGHASSMRMVEHHGYHIMLETTYRVTIDGKLLKAPLMVDDAGMVHCHSLPNYQFNSAVEMVKAIVDQFPDEFPPKGSGRGHMSMPASAKAEKKPPKKAAAKRKTAKKSAPKKKASARSTATKASRRKTP